MTIESLNKPIVNEDGYLTELGELIADDKALDLAEWVDQNTFLAGCPQRLIAIAQKVREGEALNDKDRQYLSRYRRQTQKSLFENVTF
jgi:hypothetical protein